MCVFAHPCNITIVLFVRFYIKYSAISKFSDIWVSRYKRIHHLFILAFNIRYHVLSKLWGNNIWWRSYHHDYDIMCHPFMSNHNANTHNIMLIQNTIKRRYYLGHVRLQNCDLRFSRRLSLTTNSRPFTTRYMYNRHDKNIAKNNFSGYSIYLS